MIIMFCNEMVLLNFLLLRKKDELNGQLDAAKYFME